MPLGQECCDFKLVQIGLTDCLEPLRRAICLEPDQAETGARVELCETARER